MWLFDQYDFKLKKAYFFEIFRDFIPILSSQKNIQKKEDFWGL